MSEKHEIRRVRHELRRRLLTVSASERITPKMARITLVGEALSGFSSAGYDDHIKLCFPEKGEASPIWPAIGPDAVPLADGVVASPMRDFTPRRHDAVKGELVVDFALHDAGPATEWATRAVPGDVIGVGGPRGSFVVADDFDAYLLVGDETALPAIGRRLEELRPGCRVIVIAAVTGEVEQQEFESRADVDVRWLHRPLEAASDPAPLLSALRDLVLPEGDIYAWIAGESDVVKQLRRYLVEERGINRAWIKAAGYWRCGSIGVHESHNEA